MFGVSRKKKCYTEQIQMLAEVAAEAAGVESVDPLAILAALAKRLPAPQKRGPGVSRYQGMAPLSPGGIRDMLCATANRRLANRVARVAIRVLGPDATLRESYPLYVAFAERLGLQPWAPGYFRKHAFGFRPYRKPVGHVLL